jgi:transposase
MSGEPTIDDILSSANLSVEVARKIISTQQEQISAQQKEIDELRSLNEELRGKSGKNPTPRLDEAYSVAAEARRKKNAKRKRKNKNRRVRMTTADKVALASRTETVYPAGRSAADCRFSHDRVAWRLEDGKATLVAYKIYRYRNEFGKPDGLMGRSEFGVEIKLALAYQVYIVGVSIDKACQLLNFFEQLKIRKSQADALLNQLARSWENEFETLCSLLANSAVVHCDETSWSINSVWAFLNDKLTVMFYGVHKDGETLEQILDKNAFAGTLVSDNAAVYQGFTSSQKCWAHLLRKAIKLTLEDPENSEYRQLADRLLLIYRDAKKAAADGRLGDAGRKQRVSELEDRVVECCLPGWTHADVGGTGTENDALRLCNEIMKLMIDRELFVFVEQPSVAGTNNASERQLRGDALARKTGRTSKTPNGARRQSIITSVLQSIGKQLEVFQLQTVIDEVARSTAVGQSCFDAMADALQSTLSPDQLQDKSGILARTIINADT